MFGFRLLVLTLLMSFSGSVLAGDKPLAGWKAEWPRTDFSRHSVDFDEILSGGPPKDGIPAIDDPKFVDASDAGDLAPSEPVIGLEINGDARAYPLRVLIWHEIVNDTVGGVPVTVTYCPLCNSSIVFDRRVKGGVMDFGTTGKLRNSDLVMYDRQTESWWQQFEGRAIVGAMTGTLLDIFPSRLESIAAFRARFSRGKVLVPAKRRNRKYGITPYVGYDRASRPVLYDGEMPEGIEPMVRVVAVGGEAWSLPLLRKQGVIRSGGLEIRWTGGQNSALDTRDITKGRDVGNVVVRKDGKDMAHDVTFAFVFHAFRPKGVIHHAD